MPKRGSQNTQKHAWNILLPNKNLGFIVSQNVDFSFADETGSDVCLSAYEFISDNNRKSQAKSALDKSPLRMANYNLQDNFTAASPPCTRTRKITKVLELSLRCGHSDKQRWDL